MREKAPPDEAAAQPSDPPVTQTSAPPDPHELQPLPLDRVSPQFTLRAILTGMILGAILSTCNVYAGLRIGWGFNMAISACLLSYGAWQSLHVLTGRRVKSWGILENNINMTAAASAGAVSSAGLVAPIPALAMLTGQTLSWPYLSLWVFSVCMVGITVGIGLRRQMLIVDKLSFPQGVASAETLREIYAKGSEAVARVLALLGAGLVAVGVKLVAFFRDLKSSEALPLPGTWHGFSLKSLTFAFDPTLLFYGVGGLIGIRAGLSLLVGAVLAYVVLAPPLIRQNYIRLTVAQPLAALPEGLKLKSEPEGFLAFNDNKYRLEWKGIMTAAERDELLGLSSDPFFQEAVAKLFAASQLTPASGAPFTTTRFAQVSEPVSVDPTGFAIPRRWGGLLRYDRKRQVLMASGAIHATAYAAVRRQLDEYELAHPDQTLAADGFRAALSRLATRTTEPATTGPPAIPAVLSAAVTYDGVRNALQLAPSPSGAEIAALQAWGQETRDVDLRATIGALLRGTTLSSATPNYNDMLRWLLWPGVTIMVVSSLVSFGFSWRAVVHAMSGLRGSEGKPAEDSDEVKPNYFLMGLVLALVVSVVLQVYLFAIAWWAALIGVLLSFVLALVAARVSGETGITPVGAMGKVTQFVFGALVPNNPAPNLMAANVTGGAASQCADLLHDLKCGHLLGASPRLQVWAQIGGALAGTLLASAVYMLLIPDPATQLMTDEWPAPAVAAWKAVAELFMAGLHALPPGTGWAVVIAGIAGVALPMIERSIPKRARTWFPSPASLGLAFVIPAYQSLPMFVGGLAALLLGKWCPSWSARFLIAICAGIVAGDTLTGVGTGIYVSLRTLLAG